MKEKEKQILNFKFFLYIYIICFLNVFFILNPNWIEKRIEISSFKKKKEMKEKNFFVCFK